MVDIASQFLIDRKITYLNFGSFGACPKPVFEDYQKWQRELEYNAVQFITKNGITYLQKAREALGKYINCPANDVVLVTNPSYAVNIIAKSLQLQPGDEVLTTNLEYGACDKTWQFYCKKANATYVQQAIPLPIKNKVHFLKHFFAGITKHTKLIFISHITSATAIILPVQEIVDYAKQHGILICIDGAHAPGQIDIDMQKIDADFYTGACHKWMLAPKGCSFLYAKNSVQHMLAPLVVSWGYDCTVASESNFIDYHQMQGTRDFSAFLSIPAAIQFMADNNWDNRRDESKNMVLHNAAKFLALLKTEALCPLDTDFIGQMLSIAVKTTNADKLKLLLFETYHIEIPIMPHGNDVYIRFSIQAFNTQADLDKLYQALTEIIEAKELIVF